MLSLIREWVPHNNRGFAEFFLTSFWWPCCRPWCTQSFLAQRRGKPVGNNVYIEPEQACGLCKLYKLRPIGVVENRGCLKGGGLAKFYVLLSDTCLCFPSTTMCSEGVAA